MSYLNTKPLLYGIERSDIMRDLELSIDYPSKIASQLLADEIDMGLIPVAVIPLLSEYFINTSYCIGCDGPVASVCLFSEVPIEAIETVLLDYQSRTSVQLARVLFKEHWNIKPEIIDAREHFEQRIKGATAGVVIGDRALRQRKVSPYVYDLGEAWKQMTGLPFVFAAWVSNKSIDQEFIKRFDEANGVGVKDIDSVLAALSDNEFDLHEYYTRYISYDLTANKLKGMNLFLEKLVQ